MLKLLAQLPAEVRSMVGAITVLIAVFTAGLLTRDAVQEQTNLPDRMLMIEQARLPERMSLAESRLDDGERRMDSYEASKDTLLAIVKYLGCRRDEDDQGRRGEGCEWIRAEVAPAWTAVPRRALP